MPEGAPPLPAATDQIFRPASVKEARSDVDEMAAQRVDIIKIWVDKLHGRVPEMSPEIYKAVIDEAHKRQVRVAAHVYSLKDAKQLWPMAWMCWRIRCGTSWWMMRLCDR